MAVHIDLTDRVALVTGASRGIGRAVACRLAEAGARVALIARGVERLEATAAELRELTGGTFITCPLDVSDVDAAAACVKRVREELSGLDILVNNAGITRDGLLMRMSADAWREVLDVNLTGAFALAKACARPLMKSRRGRIVNVTSVVGLRGNAGQANYAASKAGLIGFTKSLARELASRNVTVNALAPGLIDTDMTKDLGEDQRAAMTQRIPLGRVGSAGDVADAVVFLASPLASYITGVVLPVDGGFAM